MRDNNLKESESNSLLNNSKTPQPTSLSWNHFGNDYARSRAEHKRKEQETINERIKADLIERKAYDEAKKLFM
jgi:predicted ATP-binding protein involved in virulence